MAIDELKAGITAFSQISEENSISPETVATELMAIADELEEERGERVDAMLGLQRSVTTVNNSLTAESMQRQSDDEALGERITQEVLDRKADDIALHGRISTEQRERQSADETLDSRITQEVLDRKADDIALGGRISTEQRERREADEALGEQVGAEAEARENADAELRGRIGTADTRITALEQAGRLYAFAGLMGSLGEVPTGTVGAVYWVAGEHLFYVSHGQSKAPAAAGNPYNSGNYAGEHSPRTDMLYVCEGRLYHVDAETLVLVELVDSIALSAAIDTAVGAVQGNLDDMETALDTLSDRVAVYRFAGVKSSAEMLDSAVADKVYWVPDIAQFATVSDGAIAPASTPYNVGMHLGLTIKWQPNMDALYELEGRLYRVIVATGGEGADDARPHYELTLAAVTPQELTQSVTALAPVEVESEEAMDALIAAGAAMPNVIYYVPED